MTCFLLAAAPSRAASDCQPIYDAYAAMFQKPAIKRTITTPGMADPVEMVLTPDALYSRVGAKDSWGKVELNAATRSVMKKGTPSPETVTECRRIGPRAVEGVSGTAYDFTPAKMSGNAPGETITVVLDDATGLPLLETALKAGTKVANVYDGVTIPLP
ncbi:hypothetical protein BJF92_09290 [Rhizobium rhizosphaerae]|uniref:Uncharacterized protein n=1 Tax=Xaviernesmea rhizosphaerae TaxID=1672749 RepID=A0A1Q9AG56_9HYPH|nr:hypothetical protein [Xaviernesmea rhizosphaerae]OLP53943.1 hypothetical protein BJF92_09290 [Xaviernesmea rhizosphaerae]